MRSTWVLLVAVLILASSAETLADPLVVEQGFFQTFGFSQTGTFSGDNFAVSVNSGGGNFSGQVFTTGILVAGFGNFPAQVFPGATPILSFGTVQVGNVSCGMDPVPGGPDCGGAMRFINPPIAIGPPNLPNGAFTGEAPFTMTGRLVLGNQIVDIEGSGILHAFQCSSFLQPAECVGGSSARYEFSVAEPSTVVLVLSGLVGVGWSRWRGGKRAGSGRSTAAAD